MKRILSLVSLILVVFAPVWPQNTEHLDRPILRNLRTATSTFDSIFVASGLSKRVKVSFINTGPDTLVIAKGADTASITTSYQYNGTFETDSSGWTGTGTDTLRTTTAQYHGGAKSLRVASTAAGGLITSQLIQNRTAERWTNAAWVRVGLMAADTTVYIKITDRYGTLLAIDTTHLARRTWTQLSVSATLSGLQTAVRTVIGFATGTALDTIWVDDVTFKKTTDELIYLAPRMSYVDDAWPLGYLRVRSLSTTAKFYMVIGGGEFHLEPSAGSDSGIVRITTPLPTYGSSWKTFSAIDSLTRPLDATAYAANDIMTSTTTAAAMTLFRFQNVANANGGSFIINSIRVRTDTANAANGSYMVTGFKDSSLVNHVADNAASPMLATGFLNVIGEIMGALRSTGAGTGSTCSWDFQTGLQFEGTCAAGSKDIYMKWTWLAAYQPKNGGKFYIEIEGLKEVLSQ